MPRVLRTLHGAERRLDARPDRTDLRDRIYQPPLVSLPDLFPSPREIAPQLELYRDWRLVLDQGDEGACTGFGLAAVVNYLAFRRWLDAGNDAKKAPKESPVPIVSARMLYQMARVYDEWRGEDYEGSSCRGAMKGWHKHGVCAREYWPSGAAERSSERKITWQEDAARRPLGVYYRIQKESIVDMQAAIHEVGAIYASADVHGGWDEPSARDGSPLPMIVKKGKIEGGHAFAFVGYTADGFILQNSWGPSWGFHGFALLPYEDWVQNGTDAWVAVLGAPTTAPVARVVQRGGAARPEAAAPRLRLGKKLAAGADAPTRLSVEQAYEHTLVLGNNGRPELRFVDVSGVDATVREIFVDSPARQKATSIALYAHGGLNDESASLERIRSMAPVFLANGVYPLYFTWRTGALESIRGRLADIARQILPGRAEASLKGVFGGIGRALREANDRAIEAAAAEFLVKAMWTEMKQNAEASALAGGGVRLAAAALAELQQQTQCKIHLVGHSAGAILLGHLLSATAGTRLRFETATLFAPACTTAFASRHYGPALAAGSVGSLHVENMDDERELADSVGPYRKSLLYLVSRALEVAHKTPLLGLAAAWSRPGVKDAWSADGNDDVRAWVSTVKGLGDRAQHLQLTKRDDPVRTGRATIPLAHGSFDNDIASISRLLVRIVGWTNLPAPVTELSGF
jgi:hypothetical protein